jgi:hypothetical protein
LHQLDSDENIPAEFFCGYVELSAGIIDEDNEVKINFA